MRDETTYLAQENTRGKITVNDGHNISPHPATLCSDVGKKRMHKTGYNIFRKTLLHRVLSCGLIAALLLTMSSVQSLAQTVQQQKYAQSLLPGQTTYTAGKCSITYDTVEQDATSAKISCTVTNRGERPVNRWQLRLPYPYIIQNLHHIRIQSHERQYYTLTPSEDTEYIAPGGSVGFSFTVRTLVAPKTPEEMELVVNGEELAPLPTATPAPTATAALVPTATVAPTAAATPAATAVSVSPAAVAPTATAVSVSPVAVAPTATAVSVPTAAVTPTATVTSVSTATITPTATAVSIPTATVAPTAAATPVSTATTTPTATATPAVPAGQKATDIPVRSAAVPVATQKPTPAPTITATGKPAVVLTASSIEDPAEDLYIYSDTTISGDIECANLFLMGGRLIMDGHTVTVQKDYFQYGGQSSISGTQLNIGGNLHILAGSMSISAGADIRTQKDFTAENADSISIANSTLQTGGDLVAENTRYIQSTGGRLQIRGNFICAATSYYRQYAASTEISGDLDIPSGEFELVGKNDITVGGNLTVHTDGWLNAYDSDTATQITISGSLIIDSAQKSTLRYGTLHLKGDLIQPDSGNGSGLSAGDSFQIRMEGEKAQTIDLACPENVTLGTMDFQDSAGIKILSDEIHGRTISGFEKIVWKERQEFYLSGLTLGKDATIYCGTVGWHGGDINTGGHHLKIIGNMEISDACRLTANSGNVTIDNNLTINDGEMKLLGNVQLDVGGDFRIGKQGQLSTDWYGSGNPVISVQKNLIINSAKRTDLTYGNLTLQGDLIQDAGSDKTSLTIADNFEIQFEGKDIQTIDLAYPQSVTLGKINFQDSAGIKILSDEIHGRTISGFEKIVWKERQEFYLSGLTLRRDETIHCGIVQWHGGDIATSGYRLTVKGNMMLTDACRLTANSGNVTIDNNLTINDGEMKLLGNVQLDVGGDFRIGEQGRLITDWYGSGNPELDVQGNLTVDSAKQTELEYGTLNLGGDFKQTEDPDIENVKIGISCYIRCNGKTRQVIDLEGVEEIPRLDLSGSKEIYLAGDYSGWELHGVEKIVCDGGTVSLDFEDITTSSNGTIDGSLKCYGILTVDGHTLTVDGKYIQYEKTVIKGGGKLVATGDFTADKGIAEIREGTIHVKGDAHIKKNACINMYGVAECRFRTDGDYISASRSEECSVGSGTLEVKGDLIKKNTADSFGLDLRGLHLVFTGSSEQKVTTNDTVFGPVHRIDMNGSKSVDFAGCTLSASQILGFSHIKDQNVLSIKHVTLTLEQDESYNGSVFMNDSSIDCNGNTFHISDELTQINSNMILNDGCLHIGQDYSIGGTSFLIMQHAGDMLRVDGNFSMASVYSHTDILTNGRMELKGGFKQSGHQASFASSGDFVIAFTGEDMSPVGFSYSEGSGFANIDPDYDNYYLDDDMLEFSGRFIYRLSKGFLSGLVEALGIDELNGTTVALIAAFGVGLTAGAILGPPAIVAFISSGLAILMALFSGFTLARAAGGIYSTQMGTGTAYDKAEAFAHDAALLMVSYCFLRSSVNLLKDNIEVCANVIKRLVNRVTRVVLGELTATTLTYESIACYEDFVTFVTERLEGYALSYIKSVVRGETDNIETLREIAKLVEEAHGKLGRLVGLSELKAGVEMLLDGWEFDNALAVIENFDPIRPIKFNSYINNGKNYTDYMNRSGTKFCIHNQSPADIDVAIKNASNAKKPAKILEGKVAGYIKDNLGVELTDVTNEIWSLIPKEKEPGIFSMSERIGDIDCATKNMLIEVKTSVAAVKEKQIKNYIYSDQNGYFNVDGKEVVLYIDETMTNLSRGNANMIERIKGMGVTVVNSLDELREVIK